MARPTQAAPQSQSPQLKLSPRTILILFAVAVAYLLLRPTLSGWLGVKLPGLFPEEQVAVNDARPHSTPTDAPEIDETASGPATGDSQPEQPAPEDITAAARPPANSSRAPAPTPETTPSEAVPRSTTTRPESPPETPASPSIAKVSPPANAGSSTTPKPSDAPKTSSQSSRDPPPPRPKPTPNTSPQPPPTSPKPPASAQSKLGQLTDLGGKRFRSTAGLIYVQERSEHRIDHVLRHGEDDPSRPVHGVFDGDREVILAVIDEAWQLAQKGRPPKVQVEDEGDRTVYIIDLGRKIGFMGGQAGKRKRFPPCKHLQLVVEGNEVITAYPTIPR